MDVSVMLELKERLSDRVTVGVRVRPDDVAAQVDGAAVQLVGEDDEPLCPRMLLPLSGELMGCVAMSVELRAQGELPANARVVATAWRGSAQVQVAVPADPFVSMRDYVRGARIGLPGDDDVLLTPMVEPERAAWVAKMPWIDQSLRPPEVAGVIEAREDEPSVEGMAEDLGLDEEAAAWLKDLMEEPEL